MRAFTLCILVYATWGLVWPTVTMGQTSYFYEGHGYGSEAQFNPVSVLFNEGYGILQLDGWSRNLGDYPYRTGAANVWRSISNPVETIRGYGARRFLTSELLPLSTRAGGGGQWVPNYQLHMIGGGATFATLREWYAAQGAPRAGLWAGLTVTTVHLLNETVENRGFVGPNADAVADLFVFDPAGMLLYSSERVRHFFGQTLHLRSWMGQAALTFGPVALQNHGQSYAMKVPIWRRWRLFYYFGMNTMWGVSHGTRGGWSWSLGAGLHSKRLVTVDAEVNRKTAELAFTTGAFVDHKGSLLASLVYSEAHPARWLLNVYPGVVRMGRVSPGWWVAVMREGEVRAGIGLRTGLGIGL